MHFLLNHFKRYLERKPLDFCWRIGLESVAVSLAVAFLTELWGIPERDFPDWSVGTIFLFIIVLAPPFETLLLQALPIYIARKLKATFRMQIIIATLVFVIFHLAEGVATVIAAGLIGGFYFSFTYAHWRTKSRWQAFWVTTGSHVIHNGIVFILMLIFGF